MIWSGTTMSSGLTSSFRLPTAVTDTSLWTPRVFRAYMFALAGISVGEYRWPPPWRGRKATRVPSSVPIVIGSLGAPKGVSTSSSCTSASPSIR